MENCGNFIEITHKFYGSSIEMVFKFYSLMSQKHGYREASTMEILWQSVNSYFIQVSIEIHLYVLKT